TFAMMREAQRRGHSIHACETRHLLWQRGSVVQAQVRSIRLTGAATDWFSETASQTRDIRGLWCRCDAPKDPPFDSEYFYASPPA
ncbi:MAG: hypothetical protein V9F03_04615, partial [Microthrixaceae bacterium]